MGKATYIPTQTDNVKALMESTSVGDRFSAMIICSGSKKIPVEIILKGLDDSNPYVRQAALTAAIGRKDIPPDTILNCMQDEHGEARLAIFTAIVNGYEDILLARVSEHKDDIQSAINDISSMASTHRRVVKRTSKRNC